MSSLDQSLPKPHDPSEWWLEAAPVEESATPAATEQTSPSGNLGLELPVQQDTTTLNEDVAHNRLALPDSPEALLESAAKAEKTPRFTGRQKLIGAALATVVVGGGTATALALSGSNAKPKAASTATVKNNPTKPSPVQTAVSHTSLPASVTAPANNPASVNLATIVAGEEVPLGVADARVPEFLADPVKDPAARLSAFLADYSYYLSAKDDVAANVALKAITTDPNVTISLQNLRHYWQQHNAGQMLWFWTEANAPQVSITGTANQDGSATVDANEVIYYKVLEMPNGVWGAPATLNKEGASSIAGMTLRFQHAEDGTSNGFPNNLVGSKLAGRDSAGVAAVFPT